MKRNRVFTFLLIFCVLSITSLIICSASQTADYKEPSVLGYSESSSFQVSRITQKQPRWSYQTVGTVNDVAVSANGAYVLIGTSDGYVYLFNAMSNVPLDAVNIGGSVNVLDSSYYGEYIVAATGNTLEVYNVTGTELNFLWSFTNDPGVGGGGIYSLAFSRDGRLLVVGTWAHGHNGWVLDPGDSYVHVFNTTSGANIWSKQINHLVSSSSIYDYVSVDVSSDGNYIVAGSTYNHHVYLFNNTSSTPLHTYDTTSEVHDVSISSEGQYYVAGSNVVHYFKNSVSVPQWSRDIGGSVGFVWTNSTHVVAVAGSQLWALDDGGTAIWDEDLKSQISCVSVSSAGNNIVVVSEFFIHVFTKDGDYLWSYHFTDSVTSISISEDGKYIVAGCSNNLFLFDRSYDQDLTPRNVRFSDTELLDGDTIIVSSTIDNIGNLDSLPTSVRFFDGRIIIGDIEIGAIKSGLSTDISISCTLSPSGLHQIKVVVDSKNLIYESNETNNEIMKTVAVEPFLFVDSGANPIITDITQTGIVNSISTSDDGYYTVVGTSDNYVYLFFRNHTAPIWSYMVGGHVDVVGISVDGSYIATASQNTMYVFSRTNNNPLWSFTNDPGVGGGGIYSLAFSRDGRLLVVGTWAHGHNGWVLDPGDSYVHVFNTTSGANIWSKQINHLVSSSSIYDYVSVDVSSDGNYIVAGSTYNHHVYLFTSASPTPIYSYDTGAAVNSVSMSDDGQHFAVASNNYVYYFSKDVIVPIRPPYDLGNTVNSISLSSDGTLIAAAAGNYVYLIDAADDTIIWNSNLDSTVAEAIICNNGNYIVARNTNHAYLFSTTEDGNVSTPEHEPAWSYDTKNTVSSISTSSDGRYTAIGSGGKMFFFDVLHRADLMLTSITFSDDTPNEDDVISINATILNTGTHKSYFANVSFYDGSALIRNVQVNSLSPSSLTTASLNYVCLPDYRTIKVVVDEENEIYESNKTNNQLTETLYVNARPVPVTLDDPTDATSTSMRLSWSKNTEPDFARYEVYVSTSSGELGTIVKSITDQTKTSYVVGNLTASTTYYFTIRVVDSNDAFSDSNQVTGTTLPTPVVLNDPANSTPVSLDLSWTKNMDLNFESYEIYKSTSPEELGTLVAEISDQSITTYKVTELDPSTTYYFAVRAVNPQGLSSDSNQVTGTTATADFTLNVFPSSQAVIPGESASYTVNVTSQWTFSVHLTVSGLPTGITPSFSPQTVTPNGTSTLTIATPASASGGSYTLTITGKSGEITHTKNVTLDVIKIDPNDIKQTKTGTTTFSLTKTLEESKSFSIEGVTITLSARAEISITMPVEVFAESNATKVENGTGAWIIITMNSKSATIKVTLTVTVTIAELSKSITKTWTKSFTTPLGTSEVVFDTISIPAIDVLIGKVTIDLTPRAILQGHVNGNIVVNGPGTVNKQDLQWTTQGSRNVVFVTFDEDKDIEVDLSSSTLSVTKMTIIMDVGASLKTIIGSESYDLGSLPLPISTTISINGSPDSVTLAKFSGSTPSPFEDLIPTELWIYIVIAIAVSAATIAVALALRRRRTVTTTSQAKKSNGSGQIQENMRAHIIHVTKWNSQ